MAPLRMPQTPMSALGLGPALPRVSAQQAQREADRARRKLAVMLVAALCMLALLFELAQWMSSSAAWQHSDVLGRHQRSVAGLESERQQQRAAAVHRRGFRNDKQVVLLLAHFRDAAACAATLADAYAHAYLPARVHMRVLDEVDVGMEASCMQLFCTRLPDACRTMLRAKRLRYATRDATSARGATVARNVLENMVSRRELGDHFYASVDAGVSFAPDWDRALLQQWYSIGNDMAILSAAPKAAVLQGRRDSATTFLLQCSARIHAKGADAVVAFNPPEPRPKVDGALFAPVLQAQYSEVFHFGPVAALLAVRSDPHTPFVAVGNEYARATRFWTHGYDFYAPNADVVFATYAWQPAPTAGSEEDTAAHVRRANRRIRQLLQLPVSPSAEPPALVAAPAFALGTRRTMAQWERFSRIDPRAPYNESTTNQFVSCFDRLEYVGYEF
ncbi:hypothetical protein PybrP1_009675 [[Pythium] brassicae (nom. inval.)]|nr:hypothetical protein PybrP1_009675 [[Pythium] brassicae (nom. inval.)]